MITRAKRLARHLVERSLVPHLDAQVDQIDAVVAQRLESRDDPRPEPLHPVLADFNHLLHELRTIELRSLPVHGGVLLSAGCAGRWYFDWVADAVGPMEHHIGVERYSPRPADLPPGITWLAESASSMPGVADESVDVVFSGQNLEHLWIDDMVGFFTESRRVLRPGGTLVIDSPNRLAVEGLGWVHPEHTVEMTAGEATELLEASGFDVRSVRGLWKCRDGVRDAWLPLVPDVGDVTTVLDRCLARRDLDDDFVWWIEAERSNRREDEERLRSAVAALFDAHWTNRVNRGGQGTGEQALDGSWRAVAGSSGTIYRTDRFPLFVGAASVRSSQPSMRVRVLDQDGCELGSALHAVDLVLDRTEFGVVAELIADAPLEQTLEGVRVEVAVAT